MDFRREKNRRGRIRPNAKKVSGGSDGCVNFEDGDNAGLASCLAWTGLNKIYENWCDKLSLADFMVLSAEAVVGAIAVDYDEKDPFKDEHSSQDSESNMLMVVKLLRNVQLKGSCQILRMDVMISKRSSSKTYSIIT